MFNPPSCLKLIHNDGFYSFYNLEDTSYVLIYDKFYNKKRAWTQQLDGNFQPGNQNNLIDVSSEKVFEEAPDGIKESLIFHLDLFLD